jgi:hypothetical protein
MSPKFELFELICSELDTQRERVITETVLSWEQREDLAREQGATSDREAMERGLKSVSLHFVSKGARLPFNYDLTSGRFIAEDIGFIRFIALARSTRGSGLPAAKHFEIQTWRRLSLRATGQLHLVGAPRKRKRRRAEFLGYLQQLGFGANVLEANDKDGGFDILWLPPLGAVPIRPVVSLQCKNSSFDREEAFESVAQAERSLHRHTNMGAPGTYLCCVIFNDYIDDTYEGRACGWHFVPLGLSDMASLGNPLEVVTLS